MTNTWYLMCFLSAISVLIAFTNQFVLKMQTTIAITTASVIISLLMIVAVKMLGNETALLVSQLISGIDFNQLLLQGVLGLLLFAGALEINIKAIKRQRWEITTLVLFSTLASTFFIGYVSCWFLEIIGTPIPFVYCLLFGALISPTDPIAVLAIIKKMNAPEGISVQVEGESLFNDGVGLVVFKTIFAVAFTGVSPNFGSVAELFLVEALGGIAFGLALAVFAHYLIILSNDYSIRLLITFCIPTAGFAAANIMDVSGALAMVVCGIFIGNVTRDKAAAMSLHTSIRNVRNFWHAVDGYLNSLLFLLMGLILVTLTISINEIMLGIVAIPIVLLARFISVACPYLVFRRFRKYDLNSVRILTWGGLRGGLALAMAASVPSGYVVLNGTDLHTLIVVVTYIVVIFSIIVQGLTITPLIRKSIEASNRNKS